MGEALVPGIVSEGFNISSWMDLHGKKTRNRDEVGPSYKEGLMQILWGMRKKKIYTKKNRVHSESGKSTGYMLANHR